MPAKRSSTDPPPRDNGAGCARRKDVWPVSPEDRADRIKVVRLVHQVGRSKLRFSAHDLARAAEQDPKLRLTSPAMLHRHLHFLSRSLIVPVESRFAAGTDPKERRPRSRHTWVLAEREQEYRAGPPPLDDQEKTLMAVWVASAAEGGLPPCTRAVSRLLEGVPDLVPERWQKTAIRLMRLCNGSFPLLRVLPNYQPGQTHWLPIGPKPTDPRFKAWVAQARQIAASRGNSSLATVRGLVAELVERTIKSAVCAEYPKG